jgi:ABC-type multidrug transport system permease subunit
MRRSIALIFVNEFRLLQRDRASLFMLFIAPVVIIAVAGFSLGNLFGAPSAHNDCLLPLVDQDHGRVAAAMIDALASQRNCKLVKMNDLAAARRRVLHDARAPLVLLIPSHTTSAFESGQTAQIEVLVDPLKRLQALTVELRLNELSEQLASSAQMQMRQQFTSKMAELRSHLAQAAAQSKALELAIRAYRRKLSQARTEAQLAIRAKIEHQLDAVEAQSQASLAEVADLTQQRLAQAMAGRRAALRAVASYLQALRVSQAEFNQWLARLQTMAGSRAAQIPPPPHWPAPPNRQQLDELTQSLTIPLPKPRPPAINIANLNFKLPDFPPLPRLSLDSTETLAVPPAFPGAIAWKEASLTSGRTNVSAFEQYVPGFGVTFLLIDMLWGMSVALMDERQWGTLQRLRISGASAVGMLIGKLSARTLIGFLQMIVLFGVGWLLFDIRLGTNPAMLMLPAGAIAFAAAAFGLLVAAVAPTRDSVLPIGSVAAMVMSAVGGCWWPLEFEPVWMRSAALSVPTTWTMRAFNDLMIRGLEPGAALRPSAMALALGLVLLLGGIAGSPRLYR